MLNWRLIGLVPYWVLWYGAVLVSDVVTPSLQSIGSLFDNIKGLAEALEEKRILLEEIQALKAEKSKLSTERPSQSTTPSPRVAAPTPKSTPAPSRSPSDERMDSDDDEAWVIAPVFLNERCSQKKYILKVQL